MANKTESASQRSLDRGLKCSPAGDRPNADDCGRDGDAPKIVLQADDQITSEKI